MEKILRKFSSFDATEQTDYDHYAAMTPEERLCIALNLYWMVHDINDPASHRVERVFKIVRFSELNAK